MRTLSRGHFLEVFASFKAHLRNLVRSLFLVALQTECCKPATPVKKGLLEISRKAIFRNMPWPSYFFRQSYKT